MSRVRRISYAITPEGRRSNAIKQAIDLRDKVLSIVDNSNFSSSTARKITKKAAFSVVMRSLEESKGLPLSLREHLAMKELNKYISLAKHNKSDFFYATNTDLLPISHPRSTREHSMTASALRVARSRWFAADPRITDERAKAVLASAFEAIPGSVEHLYYTSILLSLPQGMIPGEALIAASDGNSSASRSARARRQRRDSKGRFAYQGGGIRALIRRLNGDIFSISGRVVANAKNNRDVEVEFPDGKIAEVNPAKGEYVKAVLPTPDGYSPEPITPSVTDEVINEKDLVFVDAPNGWIKDEKFEDENAVGPIERYVDSDKEFIVFINKQNDGTKNYNILNAKNAELIDDGKNWADVQDILEGKEDQFINFKSSSPSKEKITPEPLPFRRGLIPAEDRPGPNAYEKLMAEKKDKENAIANRRAELKKNADDRVDALDRTVPEGWDIEEENNALMLRRATEPADLENIYKQDNFVARVVEQGEISVKDKNNLLENKVYQNWAYVDKDKNARATEYARKAREEIKKFAPDYGYKEEDLNKIDSMSAAEIASFFLDEKLQPEGFSRALDDYMTSAMVDAPSQQQERKWKNFGQELRVINDAGDFPSDNKKKADLPKQPDAPVENKGGFEFNYPDRAYKIKPNSEYDIQGRVDEESTDFTDDPIELAQKQDERDILAALEQAVSPGEDGENALGVGALPFNKGDEFVPAEALFFALQEAGMDAPMELAKIYDKKLGNDNNEKALIDFRKKAETVSGNIPELAESFKKVTEQDPDLEPPTQEPKFDAKEMDLIPLPPLLEGLSEKELDQFNETKDHIPYLPKNEEIEMPEGYNPLSPEPFAAWKEVTAENPDPVLPEGFSDNPVFLAQEITTDDLLKELRRSVEPGNEVPGAAVIALPTDDGEDFVANVPGEAVRDALQLKGIDTNAELEKIAEEGFEGQIKPVAEIPEPEITDKEIFDRRMAGESLQDLADDLGITREEVRAREAKYARENPEARPEETKTIEKDQVSTILKEEEDLADKYELDGLTRSDAQGKASADMKRKYGKTADEALLDLSPEESKTVLEENEKRIKEEERSLPAEAPTKDITKYKLTETGIDEVDISGTSLQGNISATSKQLEAVFGKPDLYEDEKVKVLWAVKFDGPDGEEVASIYDWKNNNAPGDDEVYDWHIGGNSPLAVELVKNVFSPPEASKPVAPVADSENRDLIFDGDISLEDQINNAIEKGIRIGFFYNGSQRLVTPLSIFTNPKNGNVNVRVLDENGDNKTFTISNMEDGKGKKELSTEDQRVLDSNEWVQANAGRLAPIFPQNIKEDDYLWNRFHKRYEKVISEGEYAGTAGTPRFKFKVFNPKNNQVETRYYEPNTEIRNVRRLGLGEVPEDFVVPVEPSGSGKGPKRGLAKRKSLDEPVFAREGRKMGGSIKKREKQSKYEDRNGISLAPGDVVRYYDSSKDAVWGRGVVKSRIGAQTTEAGKVGGQGRKQKVYLGNLFIQWENEDKAWVLKQGGRSATSNNLILQEGDNSDIKLPNFRGVRAVPNSRSSITPDSEKTTESPVENNDEAVIDASSENISVEQYSEVLAEAAEKINPATEKIANSIIEALERGTAPWRKPWTGGGFLPTSVSTGKTYEGSNILVLWAAQEKNNWTDNRWLTFMQAEKLGGNIKRGEKGTQIVHWKPSFKEVEKTDGTKEEVFVYMPPKVITVFNAEQAENINLPALVKAEPVPVTEAETKILDSYKDKPEIKNVPQDQAYYNDKLDIIRLPQREQFKDPKDYLETLIHELAHSTGNKNRLNRSNLLDNYANHTESRGEEELIAEIAVSLAAARLGVEIDFDNVASYAQSWLRALKDDKTMIVKAAKQAQKAVDYMLGKQEEPAKVDEKGKLAEPVDKDVNLIKTDSEIKSYFPRLQDYKDGGSGGLVGSRSTVGFVSTDVLKNMAGNAVGKEESVEAYRKSLREGKGFAVKDFDGKPFNDPIMVIYDNETGLAFVGEGNHRLQAAIAENIPYVPVRVIKGRESEMVEDAEKGRFPKQIKNDKEPEFLETGSLSGQPVSKGYVPPEMHPSYVFDKKFISDEVPDFATESNPSVPPATEEDVGSKDRADEKIPSETGVSSIKGDYVKGTPNLGELKDKMKYEIQMYEKKLFSGRTNGELYGIRKIVVSGNTFPNKEELKKIGFSYNKENKTWEKSYLTKVFLADKLTQELLDNTPDFEITNDFKKLTTTVPKVTPEPNIGEQGKTGEEISSEKRSAKKAGNGLDHVGIIKLASGVKDSQRKKLYNAEMNNNNLNSPEIPVPVAPKLTNFKEYEDYVKAYKQYQYQFAQYKKRTPVILLSEAAKKHLDGTTQGLQKYINEVVESDWFQEKFGDGGVVGIPEATVRPKGPQGQHSLAGFGYNRIFINARHAKDESTILHEIAHYATAISATSKYAAHGVEFAKNHLDISKNVIGSEYEDNLKKEYRKTGVRFE